MPKLNFFEKIGDSSNGRTIYQAKKSNGEIYKISIPKDKEDHFEKLNIAVDDDENIRTFGDEKNFKKAKRLMFSLMALGCCLGVYLSRKMDGFKKGFITLASGIGGIAVGSFIFINKNKKLEQEIDKLDIKEFKNE